MQDTAHVDPASDTLVFVVNYRDELLGYSKMTTITRTKYGQPQ